MYMKKVFSVLLMTLVFLISISCKNYNKREDIAEMPDKTFYLLPIESHTTVNINLSNRDQVWSGIGDAVVKGVNDMDVNKIAAAFEKRYGIKVDTSYFEKARKDDDVSRKYFDAIRHSQMRDAPLVFTHRDYLDSDFFKETQEIMKNKSYIQIHHTTSIPQDRATTSIWIWFVVKHPKGNGVEIFTINHKHGASSDFMGGFFSGGKIDYDLISKSISDICNYKYNDDLYLNGDR